MVTLPTDFVATKYPGYFWNLKTKKLFSVKVTGELKQMAFSHTGYHISKGWEPAYRVSVNGVKRNLYLDYLNSLTAKNSIFPVSKI